MNTTTYTTKIADLDPGDEISQVYTFEAQSLEAAWAKAAELADGRAECTGAANIILYVREA